MPPVFLWGWQMFTGDSMSKVSTNIRIDMQTKEEASAILENLGFSVSGAVNIFLRQVVLNKGLPFEISLRDAKQEK